MSSNRSTGRGNGSNCGRNNGGRSSGRSSGRGSGRGSGRNSGKGRYGQKCQPKQVVEKRYGSNKEVSMSTFDTNTNNPSYLYK